MKFFYEPPATSNIKLSYPAPKVVLVTMDRPKKMNALDAQSFIEITQVFNWIDDEPALSVAILTGAGDNFSTGADLSEWVAKAFKPGTRPTQAPPGAAPGAIPVSNRLSKKPIIAAVKGLALGGGCETVINCDLVVAAENATFGLVEIKRGLAAYAGAMPRLIRTVGLQRASEMALLGDYITAQQAEKWGFVNRVVPSEQVVEEAIKYAKAIAGFSLQAVLTTKAGLRQGWETASVVEATAVTGRKEWTELLNGDDCREGLAAFRDRREPVWNRAKL